MSDSRLKILLVEDSTTDAEIFNYKLNHAARESVDLDRVCRLSEALQSLERQSYDLVLVDLSLPDAQGKKAFVRINETAPQLPIVILTGLADSRLAVETVREGAQDYLIKDEIDGRILLRAMRYAIERKRVQLDALRLRREAEEVKQKRAEFVAMVSHELRNPMTGILGYTHLLSKTPLDPLQKEYVDEMASSTRSLVDLLNSLLELSSAEAGHVKLEPAQTDLRRTLEETAALMVPQVRDKKLELVTSIDPHLPDEVVTDALKLRQVLLNLMTNAIKFTDQGYLGLSARVRAQTRETAVVRIVVEDSGRGIPKEKCKHIFQPFSQAESGDRERGAGLGLAICRRVVQAMGGVIGVESQVGRGTAFWLDLPFVIERPSSLVGSATGRKVLVVDHLHQAAQAHTFICERMGAEVVRVDHELDLFRRLREESFDLAVLSSEFLDTIGEEALQRAQVSRILVSGYERRGCQGRLCHVSRPLRLAELEAPPTAASTTEEARPGGCAGGHLLLIDDDPICARVLQAVARAQGRHCTAARDAASALELVSANSYDLILIDRNLPDGDGLELARQLRRGGAVAAEVPLVMLSGELPPPAQQLERWGINRYLTKPLDSDELSRLLDRCGGEPELIDWQVLEKLKRYQRPGDDLMAELVDTFLTTSRDRTQALRAALEAFDRDELTRLAHQLRGAASLVGATGVTRIAYQLEHLQPPEAPAPVVEQLLDALARSRDQFQQKLGASLAQ